MTKGQIPPDETHKKATHYILLGSPASRPQQEGFAPSPLCSRSCPYMQRFRTVLDPLPMCHLVFRPTKDFWFAIWSFDPPRTFGCAIGLSTHQGLLVVPSDLSTRRRIFQLPLFSSRGPQRVLAQCKSSHPTIFEAGKKIQSAPL